MLKEGVGGGLCGFLELTSLGEVPWYRLVTGPGSVVDTRLFFFLVICLSHIFLGLEIGAVAMCES